jgi:hypothetical protein
MTARALIVPHATRDATPVLRYRLRMRHASRHWVLVLALAAIAGATAGCGGSPAAKTGTAGTSGSAGTTGAAGSAGDAGQDGPPPVADPKFAPFCAAVHMELINHYDRCQGIAAEAGKVLVARDPCVWWGAAVGGNRMAFDGTNADACLAALKVAPCDADAVPAICDRALWGQQKVGDTCSLAAEMLQFSECETGDACIAGAGGCEGKCVARALLNKACGLGAPCLQGESCPILGTSTCVTKAAMGEACGYATGACQTGLYCTDLLNGGTCVPREGVGGACSNGQDACQPPLTCAPGATIDVPGSCQMAPRPGAACDPASLAVTCSLGYLTCEADMMCHPQPGLGQPCKTAAGDFIPCGAGTCDDTVANPVCKAAAAGTPCLLESDCEPNALCTSINLQRPACTAVCVPR